MIDCERAQDSMSDFLEGLLEPEKLNAVKRHVLQCSQCTRVYERMRRLKELLGGLPERAPSPAFEQNLREKLRLERERSGRSVWHRFPSLVPVRPKPVLVLSTACLAIVIGLFLFKNMFFQQKQPLFIVDSEHQTKVERVSTPAETTHSEPPARLVGEWNPAPNYVLRKISPKHLELGRDYLSPTWQSHFNREYVLGQTRLQWTPEGLQAVEYVMPSATPPRRLQAVTFSP